MVLDKVHVSFSRHCLSVVTTPFSGRRHGHEANMVYGELRKLVSSISTSYMKHSPSLSVIEMVAILGSMSTWSSAVDSSIERSSVSSQTRSSTMATFSQTVWPWFASVKVIMVDTLP